MCEGVCTCDAPFFGQFCDDCSGDPLCFPFACSANEVRRVGWLPWQHTCPTPLTPILLTLLFTCRVTFSPGSTHFLSQACSNCAALVAVDLVGINSNFTASEFFLNFTSTYPGTTEEDIVSGVTGVRLPEGLCDSSCEVYFVAGDLPMDYTINGESHCFGMLHFSAT